MARWRRAGLRRRRGRDGRHHQIPRASGRVAAKPRSCSPSMRRMSRHEARACSSTWPQARLQLGDGLGAHRDVAGEAELGVAVGELALAALDGLGLALLVDRGAEAVPAAELLVGQVLGARPSPGRAGPEMGSIGLHAHRDARPGAGVWSSSGIR